MSGQFYRRPAVLKICVCVRADVTMNRILFICKLVWRKNSLIGICFPSILLLFQSSRSGFVISVNVLTTVETD